MTGPRFERQPAAAVRTGRPWATAVWSSAAVLAGLVQVIRGEAADAVIFLVPAFLVAADAAGALPRWTASSGRLRQLLPIATVAAGVVLALTPRHGLADGVAVAALGVAVLVAAWPDPPPKPRPAAPLLHRSGAVWAAVALGIALWELVSFLLGLPSPAASIAHPAISDLLDPVADVPAGRVLLVTAWTLAGLGLLHRGWR